MNLSPQYDQETEPKQCKSEDDIRTKFLQVLTYCSFSNILFLYFDDAGQT